MSSLLWWRRRILWPQKVIILILEVYGIHFDLIYQTRWSYLSYRVISCGCFCSNCSIPSRSTLYGYPRLHPLDHGEAQELPQVSILLLWPLQSSINQIYLHNDSASTTFKWWGYLLGCFLILRTTFKEVTRIFLVGSYKKLMSCLDHLNSVALHSSYM